MKYWPFLLLLLYGCRHKEPLEEVSVFSGISIAHYETTVYDSVNGSTIATQWDSSYNDAVMSVHKIRDHMIRFILTPQQHLCAVPEVAFEFNADQSDFVYNIDTASYIHFYHGLKEDSLYFSYLKSINKPGDHLGISLKFGGKY